MLVGELSGRCVVCAPAWFDALRLFSRRPQVEGRPMLCQHRWMASRIEHTTTPVEHLCDRTADECDARVGHHCSCGAVTTDG